MLFCHIGGYQADASGGLAAALWQYSGCIHASKFLGVSYHHYKELVQPIEAFLDNSGINFCAGRCAVSAEGYL
jgi:hypothetical protein